MGAALRKDDLSRPSMTYASPCLTRLIGYSIDMYQATENLDQEQQVIVEGSSAKSVVQTLWQNLWLPQHGILVVFLVLLGSATALIALGVELAHKYLVILKHLIASTPYWGLNYIIFVVVSVAFSALGWIIVDKISPHAVGSGIPEMKSLLSGVVIHKFLSFRTLLAKLLGLVFSSASGLSIGKEGPFVHLAAMVGRNMAYHLKPFNGLWRNEMLRKQILAAGCATGVAATFGAPVGGVLFSIEVTSTYFLTQNYWKSFFCAVCGALVLHLVGYAEVLRLFSTNFDPLPYDPLELFAYVLVGILCGLLGAGWIGFLRHFNIFRNRTAWLTSRRSRFIQLLVTTFATVVIAYPSDFLLMPQKEQINHFFNDAPGLSAWNFDSTATWVTLFLFMGFKFFFTGIAVGLPVVMGVFTPVLALGACIGRAFGEVVLIIFPHLGIVPGGYAVVGAAAFASGVTRTFSTAVIIFELTGQLNHMIPVLLGALLGTAVGNQVNMSIYDVMLSLRGLPILPEISAKWHNKNARDIMHVTGVYLTGSVTYNDIVNVLQQTSDDENHVIPVVNNLESMILIGTVQRSQLQKLFVREFGQMSIDHFREINAVRNFALPSETPSKRSRSRGGMTTPRPIPLEGLNPSDAIPTVEDQEDLESDGDEEDAIQALLAKPVTLVQEVQLDRSPISMSIYTPVSRLHLMFVMLSLKHIFIMDAGKLVGEIWRSDMVEGNSNQ